MICSPDYLPSPDRLFHWDETNHRELASNYALQASKPLFICPPQLAQKANVWSWILKRGLYSKYGSSSLPTYTAPLWCSFQCVLSSKGRMLALIQSNWSIIKVCVCQPRYISNKSQLQMGVWQTEVWCVWGCAAECETKAAENKGKFCVHKVTFILTHTTILPYSGDASSTTVLSSNVTSSKDTLRPLCQNSGPVPCFFYNAARQMLQRRNFFTHSWIWILTHS